MPIETMFILYAMLFKLAIIGSGSLCIFLGYRLFTSISGIRDTQSLSGENSVQQTTASAKIGIADFSLKTAAPGTSFAGFGVFLIVSMLVTAPPSLELSDKGGEKVLKLKGSNGHEASFPQYSENPSGFKKQIHLAAAATYRQEYTKPLVTFDNAIRQAIVKAEQLEPDTAIQIKDDALSIYSFGLNNRADDYLKKGEPDTALPLAQLAASLSPGNEVIQKTLAQIEDSTKR